MYINLHTVCLYTCICRVDLLNKFGTISKNKIEKQLKFLTKHVLLCSAMCFINKQNKVTMNSCLAHILTKLYLFSSKNI